MDFYEGYLLQRAVEATGEEGFLFYRGYRGWRFSTWSPTRGNMQGIGDTREAALRSLLDDLGVEYAERPSAERVADARAELTRGAEGDKLTAGDALAGMERLYARRSS